MAALTDADRARLREMIEKDWVDAALAQNWDASMALCTEDFAYMPQDHPLLSGREEAKAFLDAFPTMVSFKQSLDAATGDTGLAALRGSFDLTFQHEGQEVSGHGKFLATATNQGGEWLVSAACFNWDAPPGG
jgi:ketosteroid isomerase-like protein